MCVPRIIQPIRIMYPYGISGRRVSGIIQQLAGTSLLFRRVYTDFNGWQLGVRTTGLSSDLIVVPSLTNANLGGGNALHQQLLVCSHGSDESTWRQDDELDEYCLHKQAAISFAAQLDEAISVACTAQHWPEFVTPKRDSPRF